jgi:translation elongation factor EF-G
MPYFHPSCETLFGRPAMAEMGQIRPTASAATSGRCVSVSGLSAAAVAETSMADKRHSGKLDNVIIWKIAGGVSCGPLGWLQFAMINAQPLLVEIAIEPKSKADRGSFKTALATVADKLSSGVQTDPRSGQTVLTGASEAHLETLIDRLVHEFGIVVVCRRSSGRLSRDDHPRVRNRL